MKLKSYNRAIQQVYIDFDEDDPQHTDRYLTPVEVGQTEIFYTICRVKCGFPERAVPEAAPDSPPPKHGATPVGQRKVKMSSVADQTDETEIALLDNTTLLQLAMDYEALFGMPPDDDEEASADQLSALKQKVDAGLPPYAEFAVWSPHYRRTSKRLKFTVVRLNAQGEFQRTEQLGPKDFAQWWACFRVWKCANLMLKYFQISTLDRYGEFIRQKAKDFPDAWHLLNDADDKGRSEGLERIMRDLNAKLERKEQVFGFKSSMPWDWCLRELMERDRFWKRELELPSQREDQARRAQWESRHAQRAATEQRPPKRQAPPGGDDVLERPGKRSPATSPPSSAPDVNATVSEGHCKGMFLFDASGTEICRGFSWNRTGCTEPCRTNRAHICGWCRGAHRSCDCTQRPEGWEPDTRPPRAKAKAKSRR